MQNELKGIKDSDVDDKTDLPKWLLNNDNEEEEEEEE